MLTLRLHEIECIQESSELGSDEPYVVMVAIDLGGSVGVPFGGTTVDVPIPQVNVKLYGPYGDMDSGDKKKSRPDEPNVWNLEGRPSPIHNAEDVVFLAALLENDDGDPSNLISIVEGTITGALVGSLGSSRDVLVRELIENLDSAVRTPTGAPNFDDQISGPQEVRFVDSEIKMAGIIGGIRKRLVFRSVEGVYGLTFELKSPSAHSGLRSGHILEHRENSEFLSVDQDAEGFRAATRPTGQNERLRWKFHQKGGVYRIRTANGDQYLDAFEGDGFRCALRNHQDNDTQLWVISPDHKGESRIQQLSSSRFLDAFQGGDFSAVTRERQSDKTQKWSAEPNSSGRYLIRQESSERILAKERGNSGVQTIEFEALKLAIEELQAAARAQDLVKISQARKKIIGAVDAVPDDKTWELEQIGAVYEIEHMVTGRFLDAFEDGRHSVMTRERQDNDSQRWVVIPNGDTSVSLRQLNTGRYLDAFTSGNRSTVTRTKQSDGTQDWIVQPL